MSLQAITARAPSRVTFLFAFATFELTLALAIAWALGVSLFFPNGVIASYIVERADLIRAHIDYLMMAQFLFIFALMFRQYAIRPPLWILVASCSGAFYNPASFLLRALRPKVDPATITAPVEPHFPLIAGLSFTAVTVGFIGSAALVVYAAWRSSRSSASARADALENA
ncbi:hypothetical protein [Methylosinus sp. Sm6]|uniref:hypothetical protein n=1 Tax=Methylosinus sp. Sm6 TaxID=2866948 RepID=UPI001C99ECF9|nr:hypothetical protein [Methylosinus sp. Sm6]MBY6243295.1 hypothetical protein [Methylosinus sp. Sm6]